MRDAVGAGRPFTRSSHRPLAGTRLSASPLLSDRERRALDDIALTPRAVRPGDELVREGVPVDHLYCVTGGWALRVKMTGGGDRQVVGVAVPGDLANMDAYLFGRLDYDVRALTHGVVVPIPRDRLLAAAAEHPGIARALTWTALVENAVLSQWAMCLGRQSALQRLAHLPCELAVRLGTVDEGDGAIVRFDLPMTQEHLADALGLTAVHLNRVMQQLRGDGLIVTASRSVTVPDMARLRHAGGFDPAYLHLDGEGPVPPAAHGDAAPMRAAPTAMIR